MELVGEGFRARSCTCKSGPPDPDADPAVAVAVAGEGRDEGAAAKGEGERPRTFCGAALAGYLAGSRIHESVHHPWQGMVAGKCEPHV